MNPAPDADFHSVGAENFTWIVNAVADLAVKYAQEGRALPEYRWSSFLNGAAAPKAPAKRSIAAKSPSTRSKAAK
jgi:hypothetical protein